MKIISAVMIALLLCGCGYARIAKRNNDQMLNLNIGQTKQEVLDIMGNPARHEEYFSGGKQIDVLFYRTSPEILDWGMDDNFTPVILEDGKLTGWGKDYYVRRIEFQSEVN